MSIEMIFRLSLEGKPFFKPSNFQLCVVSKWIPTTKKLFEPLTNMVRSWKWFPIRGLPPPTRVTL
jgi:hypothetical protein